WVAGERKDVLFTVHSLLDLIQTGARLYANHRYPETMVDVSRETATTGAGSYDEHRTVAWTDGWRRTQSGKDLKRPFDAHKPGAWPFEVDRGPQDVKAFESYHNAETRSFNELVGHEGAGVFFDKLRTIANNVAANNPFFHDSNFWPDPSRG